MCRCLFGCSKQSEERELLSLLWCLRWHTEATHTEERKTQIYCRLRFHCLKTHTHTDQIRGCSSESWNPYPYSFSSSYAICQIPVRWDIVEKWDMVGWWIIVCRWNDQYRYISPVSLMRVQKARTPAVLLHKLLCFLPVYSVCWTTGPLKHTDNYCLNFWLSACCFIFVKMKTSCI